MQPYILRRLKTDKAVITDLPDKIELNAYCGLNLAAHALGRADASHGWLYASPDEAGLGERLRGLARPAARLPSRAEPVRMAADAEEPITTCSNVVSVVERDITSRVRVVSKNSASSRST